MNVDKSTGAGAAPRLEIFVHALAFVLGFGTIFVILGMAATGLGRLLGDGVEFLAKVGGLVVILFGLFTAGALKISFMSYDTRRHFAARRDGSLLSSYMMGVFFSAGWTPCLGPTLGAILALGFQESTVAQGGFLLVGYCLGLGTPFLLTGLAVDRTLLVLRKLQRHMPAIKLATGLLLVGLGVLMLIDAFHLRLPGWVPTLSALKTRAAQSAFQQSLFELETNLNPIGASPTFWMAVLAGLLSFLSPCVLPLVPVYIGYLGGRALEQVAREGGCNG
jgi:cytochrome c-type biogenesis protein